MPGSPTGTPNPPADPTTVRVGTTPRATQCPVRQVPPQPTRVDIPAAALPLPKAASANIGNMQRLAASNDCTMSQKCPDGDGMDP